MSALDDIATMLADVSGWSPAPLTEDEAREQLRPFLDKHAHELAELIRANCNMNGVDLPDTEDAADFIDPEVPTCATR